jgi:hypothetical protein
LRSAFTDSFEVSMLTISALYSFETKMPLN